MAVSDAQQSQSPPLTPAEADLLGHPRGLVFLFSTEMWERFSYYGMRALLTLYMVKYLLLPGHHEGVIGLATLRSVLESMSGPLGVQPFSSQIYGIYTGLVYFTPLIGGIIADRVLGQHRTIIIGAALMAVGHFMMAFEPLFLFALLMLILGNGAFKPNMSAQVGSLYHPGDPRRDRAYSIFYVGINLGAFLAPLVCGTLGEEVGWHYGFGAAGVGMTVALVIYLYALYSRSLPPDELHKAKALAHEKLPLTRVEWESVLALIVVCIPVTLFWATYEQQGNTIALWADDHTDRTIDLFVWHGEIPTTWFQSFNPFMIFAFTPFIIALWAAQAKRGSEPSTVTKMAIGCFMCSASYLIMAAAAWVANGDDASWLWLFAFFVVITTGELYLSPIGLSLVSKVAPAHMVSLLMGVWLATSFIGNFLAGWLGSFWSSDEQGGLLLDARRSLGGRRRRDPGAQPGAERGTEGVAAPGSRPDGRGSLLHRQSDIILRERARGSFRTRHVIELGQLALAVERIVCRMEMQELRHPPGEALRLPHPPQARRRIAIEEFVATRAIEFRNRARQDNDIGNCEVHALGAGRRLDVRGIACEEQPPVLHRLDHETAHRGDALFPAATRPPRASACRRSRACSSSQRRASGQFSISSSGPHWT